jgi:hypothetical protein
MILLACAAPVLVSADETLTSKVVRIPLNQNEPALVKLGTHGITTLEFPYRIEALDGFGFSPSPDGQDLFQISFNKGTNFLSLKAMREGVEGNLTVVLDGKVYCLFCKTAPDPSFVVVFENNSAKTISHPNDFLAKNKRASPARLLGLLDKVKAYPTLKISAPEVFQNMEVSEPNSDSSVDGLKVTLRRLIRDEGLDAVGFEVELANRTNKDFLYDPESFGVRIGDEVYPQAITDASGVVQAGKILPAFFVVAGTATGGRNDLAVTNKFDVTLRKITEGSNSRVPAIWQEPPDTVPIAQQRYQETALPASNRDQTSREVIGDTHKKARAKYKRRNKILKPSGEIHTQELVRKGRGDDETATDE